MNNIIDIPDHLHNIVVLYSGGVDSTIMLYMLAHKYPHKNITAMTAGCSYIDNRVHLPPAYNVIERINWLIEPGAINQHIIHYNTEATGHHCSSALNEFHTKDPIDLVMIGQNKAPPKGTIMWKWLDEKYVDLYDLCESKNRLHPTGSVWSTFENKWKEYRPLKFLDKKEVVQLFRDNNVFDQLIPLTRSCTRTYDQNFIDNRPPSDPRREYKDHCGWCWYCLEREWGLQEDDK